MTDSNKIKKYALIGVAGALGVGIFFLLTKKPQSLMANTLPQCPQGTEGQAKICRVGSSLIGSVLTIVANYENVGMATDRLFIDFRNKTKNEQWGVNRQLSQGLLMATGFGGQCSSEFGARAQGFSTGDIDDEFQIMVGHIDCNGFAVPDQVVTYKRTDGILTF